LRGLAKGGAVAMSAPWLALVGIGEDGVEGLSPLAVRLVGDAALVAGGSRHLALADGIIRGRRLAWPSPMAPALEEIAAHRGHPVAVLASGDPFHFGVGSRLAALVPPAEIVCLPRPSAFSLAAARLGWALQDAVLASLHGRPLEGIVRHLHPGARILALSWDETTPARLARLLADRGMGASRLTILEALGGPRERVRDAAAAGFDLRDIRPLNTVGIEVAAQPEARIVGYAAGLADSEFENDGQLTKREVRAVTLAALAPRRGELLWDVGLGAGSVAIEWLLHDASLRAIGIEERPERAARAARNAAALGAPDLMVVEGRAPQALAGLAAPDAAFIGGGLTDEGVAEAVWAALKPGGRLVANAVSLEGEQRLAALFLRHGGELVRIAITRADPVGTLFGWRPAMPVTQWRAVRP
jgi:precorrin-6Y C5,15-methyltransferase (decarboxylating)